MIIITGAAGFIGSCLSIHLNQLGRTDLVLVDDFSHPEKAGNWRNIQCSERIDRTKFLKRLNEFSHVDGIFHIGARTDTTEFDRAIFDQLNVSYSKELWNHCVLHQIPLIYASSAATYGALESGFQDDHSGIDSLKPLNAYGDSKQQFDQWVLQHETQPPFWAGLKFFNVYGPNEYHKGRMASVIFHAFHQIQQTGKMKLFQSHRDDIAHGEQKRDFIYIKDLLDLMIYLFQHQPESGIYNAGSGTAESFNTLARSVFKALDLPANIEYIPTPEDIRNKYQYFTEADMSKARRAGFTQPFTSLEEGAGDYVKHYLKNGTHFDGSPA
jgi:ADP-L-glycero-D-manno-heptose 6-epimerase